MSVIFTFPGQGAQRPGMLDTLPESRAVVDTLAEAGDCLATPVAALDSASALEATDNVQLALTIAGVAAARHLIAEAGAPAAVMGLSIGAWPAAVIAGVVSLADALALVAIRGRAMAEAYPEGYGMLAVLGLDFDAVTALVEQANAGGDELYIANINAPDQIVVAGADPALARLADAGETAGARRTQRLAMNVPSHCALLDAPAARLAEAAGRVTFAAPALAYLSANARRRLWRGPAVADDLVYNMARPVHWAESAQIAHESGFTLAVEMPPGHTLTRLHPAIDTPGEAVAVEASGWHNAAALIRRAERDV